MSTKRFFSRGLTALLAVFLVVGLTFSQDLVVKDGSTYGGTGTYNVRGNIKTSTLTVPKTIGGTVKMARITAGNQTIGTAGTTVALTFGTLQVNTAGGAGNVTTTQEVAGVVVSDALSVANGSTFDIAAKTLTIAKASTLNASGALDVSDASSVVNYTGADLAGQVVLGLTYAGTLNLTGAGSAKTFSAGGSAVTMTHAGGNLTVDQAWSIGTLGTFATIADITAAMSFGAGVTTASITAITDISAGSLTNNSTTNALSIGTLSGNAGTITAAAAGGISFTTSATNGVGTIEATSSGALGFASLLGNGGIIRTTGSGALQFTGAATNNGAITASAGTGAITFGNTLTHNAGAITPGSGNASFAGLVTTLGPASIVGGANTLDFNGNVNNSGTISSAALGNVTFAGSFVTNTGTLTLASTSTWTYDGTDQSIAGASYGHLNLTTGGTKTAMNDITVNGDFDNGGGGLGAGVAVVTDMSTFALAQVGGGTKDNFASTLKFGGNTNGFALGGTTAAAGTVTYNGTTVTAPLGQTIAPGSYYQLQFENDAAKNLADAATITTGSGVSLAAGVRVNLGTSYSASTILTINSGGLTLVGATSRLDNYGDITVNGDLDNSGILTNNGNITVQ
ncbi:MAG: hypothetical protein Q8P51_16535 [Ignavibacteria bacterium]|nr:hypothetical protein [Ignavibacteria bacterium]